jgi:hypothetical protein
VIIGSDYLEFTHENDTVIVTIRQDATTSTAYLPIYKAVEAQAALQAHTQAAASWRPPSLIEYTGPDDRVTS